MSCLAGIFMWSRDLRRGGGNVALLRIMRSLLLRRRKFEKCFLCLYWKLNFNRSSRHVFEAIEFLTSFELNWNVELKPSEAEKLQISSPAAVQLDSGFISLHLRWNKVLRKADGAFLRETTGVESGKLVAHYGDFNGDLMFLFNGQRDGVAVSWVRSEWKWRGK